MLRRAERSASSGKAATPRVDTARPQTNSVARARRVHLTTRKTIDSAASRILRLGLRCYHGSRPAPLSGAVEGTTVYEGAGIAAGNPETQRWNTAQQQVADPRMALQVLCKCFSSQANRHVWQCCRTVVCHPAPFRCALCLLAPIERNGSSEGVCGLRQRPWQW